MQLDLMRHIVAQWRACSCSLKRRRRLLDLERWQLFGVHPLPWSEQTECSSPHLEMHCRCARLRFHPSRGTSQIDRWWVLLLLWLIAAVASIPHHPLCYETGWRYRRRPQVVQLRSNRINLYGDFHPISRASPWFAHQHSRRYHLFLFSISWQFFSSSSFLCPIQL